MGPLSAEDLQQLKEAGASAPLIQAVDEMAGRAREEVAEELLSSTGLGDEGPVATRVISEARLSWRGSLCVCPRASLLAVTCEGQSLCFFFGVLNRTSVAR